MQNNLSVSFLDLSECVPVVLVLGSLKLESLFQMVSQKCWIERNSHFPWCADLLWFWHPDCSWSSWHGCITSSYWACPPGSPHHFMPSVFLASQSPSQSWCMGLLQLKVQDFPFCLCWHWQRSACYFSLLRSLWMAINTLVYPPLPLLWCHLSFAEDLLFNLPGYSWSH